MRRSLFLAGLFVWVALTGNSRADLLGEYFDTIELTQLATTRLDPVVDFTTWPGTAPTGTAVAPDSNYSERWTGWVKIDTPGEWTFYTVSNDGVRLWVNGQQIISRWNQHTASEDSAKLTLPAGWYPIKLEHFQQNGSVIIQLLFSGPGQTKLIIPATHTSPTSPGFPSVDAGDDRTIILPLDHILLQGSGTDENGQIISWQWAQIDGPECNLSGADTTVLALGNLTAGSYRFRLTVTDNENNTASDEVGVTVLPLSAGYPMALAGPDRIVILPETSLTLIGSGNDGNGQIVAWQWTQVDGPLSATLSQEDTAVVQVANLIEGNFRFRLTVTDNDGFSGSDEVSVMVVPQGASGAILSGDLMKWHRIGLTFMGPEVSEEGTPNPFMDYRLNVFFTSPTGTIYRIPGFYAADGDAADSGATAGNRWRAYFTPDQTGTWVWHASFRTGPGIAIDLDDQAGQPAGFFDGACGQFSIAPSDKTGADFRAKGQLRYVGQHHLQFAETGEYYLKGGADSPENFLGYFEFDNTSDLGKLGPSTPDGLHHYEPHVADWQDGDPLWKGNKGKGIIGSVNYLATKGINSIYFLTYNIDTGDGMDTWIWTNSNERYRMDVSKMDQWEILFSHMDAQGLQLHVVLSEAENCNKMGAGFSGYRKLYYRELIARFAHHLAVIWNIGEENSNSDQQRRDFAQYIYSLDSYHHPITIHTNYGNPLATYDALLGNTNYHATSIQGSGSQYNGWAIEFRQRSADAGQKWAIYGDEQGPAVNKNMNNLPQLRKETLWGNLMGGGAGVEWYFGYQTDFGDCNSEEFYSAAPLWDMTGHALHFFQTFLPFWAMVPDNGLSPLDNDFVLALPGSLYALYLPNGGTTQITLPAGDYRVRWYNPRSGGSLLTGSLASIAGGGLAAIGNPPSDPANDWAVLILKSNNGDFNGDHQVNMIDFDPFSHQWRQNDTLPDYALTADVILDGEINMTDFKEWVTHWLN